MIRQIGLLVSAITVLGLGSVAQAQDQIQDQDQAAFIAAFSGQWFVFDPQYGTGGMTCTLILDSNPPEADGKFKSTATNCSEPLDSLVGWDIQQGQLGYYDTSGTRIATLGGSQQRVTGKLDATERGLIVERAQGDASTREIAAAIGRHRCIYVGLSQKCADMEDLRKPAMTEEGGTYGSVGVVVNLNVRDQPRSNAPVVGTLPIGTCLKVNFCTVASDGIWCRAKFGEQDGWVHKTAVRQGEWPVLTYVNSCGPQD